MVLKYIMFYLKNIIFSKIYIWVDKVIDEKNYVFILFRELLFDFWKIKNNMFLNCSYQTSNLIVEQHFGLRQPISHVPRSILQRYLLHDRNPSWVWNLFHFLCPRYKLLSTPMCNPVSAWHSGYFTSLLLSNVAVFKIL